MNVAKALYRRLPLLLLLVLAALLRAEQGVAELQGRTAEPSRLLRLVRDRDGRYYTYSVLGYQGHVPARQVLLEKGGTLFVAYPRKWLKQIRQALP